MVQTVSMLDKTIHTLDNPAPSAIFTAEKKSLVIDWMVKWRITDPRQFVRNNGVEMRNLENRLSAVSQAAFNDEVTKHTVRGVLSDERSQIMQNVKARLVAESKPFGIEVIDVRIKRVDFVPEVTASIYKRMTTERAQVANQLRSEGEAAKEQIRADADKQVSVIIAEATLEAQKTKGEADAQATQIYGEAFGRDPKFAQFYRNLTAYRESFKNKSDVMVIDTGSDFFKAMRGPGAAGSADAPAAVHKK
jgi:membrane protease subunit HflC